MLYPNEAGVVQGEQSKIYLTHKCWNAQFLQCSELFFPIMPHAKLFSNFSKWPTLEKLNALLPFCIQSFTGQKICFVEQTSSRLKKCFDDLYEVRIFLKGEVKTRVKNWHDFFNYLIWNTFPKTKAALNMRQFIAFDEKADFPWKSQPRTRMREQDYMTMFDEGGCIILHAGHFQIPFLFGHALYENILYGKNDLSMCAYNLTCDKDILNEKIDFRSKLTIIDETLAQLMTQRNTYVDNPQFFSLHLGNALQLFHKNQYILNS